MRVLPYVGHLERGKWKPAPSGLSTPEMLFALVFAGLPLLLAPSPAWAMGLLFGGGLALTLALSARRLLGGYTGDVLGAIEQMFELGFLLAVAASPSILGLLARP